GTDPDRLETLRASSFGLMHAARKGRNARQSLLVVVDQFEEIFRVDSEDAAAFVRLLLTAAEEPETEFRIYIVITMRSDYLGECPQFRHLPPMLNRSQYLVPRMTEVEWRSAIESPARLGGAEIALNLLQQLISDAGHDPDQLSALQHL